jgi:hypothetical protein
MEVLWRSYGNPMDHHRHNTGATRSQVARLTGQEYTRPRAQQRSPAVGTWNASVFWWGRSTLSPEAPALSRGK